MVLRLSLGHGRALRAARWAGRAIVVLGMALFVAGASGRGPGWPGGLWRAGLVVMLLGCWILAYLVGRYRSPRGEQSLDAGLGLVSVAFGLVSVFGASDEGGHDLMVEIVGALVVVGGVGMILASAASKRRAEEWRNTKGD